MRLKTFTATDMNQAMEQIRTALGDDAVILSSRPQPGGRGITVTAASDDADEEMIIESADTDPAPPLASVNDAPGIDTRLARDVEKTLQFHGVPEFVSRRILEVARYMPFPGSTGPLATPAALEGLTRILATVYPFAPIDFAAEGWRLMLIGPPGIGKTLCVAKLAARLAMDKLPVEVITTDNKRAGGVEQLASFTDILKINLRVASSRTELRDILRDTDESTRVIIDSAGTNPYDFTELKELGELVTVEGIEPVLAAAAGADCVEAEHVTRAFAFLGVRRLLVTRADIARRYGSILTAATAGGLALSNVSSTPRVAGEFMAIDAPTLARLLMKHRIES